MSLQLISCVFAVEADFRQREIGLLVGDQTLSARLLLFHNPIRPGSAKLERNLWHLVVLLGTLAVWYFSVLLYFLLLLMTVCPWRCKPHFVLHVLHFHDGLQNHHILLSIMHL